MVLNLHLTFIWPTGYEEPRRWMSPDLWPRRYVPPLPLRATLVERFLFGGPNHVITANHSQNEAATRGFLWNGGRRQKYDRGAGPCRSSFLKMGLIRSPVFIPMTKPR